MLEGQTTRITEEGEAGGAGAESGEGGEVGLKNGWLVNEGRVMYLMEGLRSTEEMMGKRDGEKAGG